MKSLTLAVIITLALIIPASVNAQAFTRDNPSIIPHVIGGLAMTTGIGLIASTVDPDHHNLAWVGTLVGITMAITWEASNAIASTGYDHLGWTSDNTEDLGAFFLGNATGYFLSKLVNGWLWKEHGG